MKFLPVQMPPLADDSMVGEGITKKMDILPSNLTCKYVAGFLLSAAEKFQRVGAKLKSATKVRDPSVFQWRLPGLSETPIA